MNKEGLRDVVSALGGCELTFLEEQFGGRIQECFRENGTLTDQQESILEGIYRGKFKRMKKRFRQDDAYSTKRSI